MRHFFCGCALSAGRLQAWMAASWCILKLSRRANLAASPLSVILRKDLQLVFNVNFLVDRRVIGWPAHVKSAEKAHKWVIPWRRAESPNIWAASEPRLRGLRGGSFSLIFSVSAYLRITAPTRRYVFVRSAFAVERSGKLSGTRRSNCHRRRRALLNPSF